MDGERKDVEPALRDRLGTESLHHSRRRVTAPPQEQPPELGASLTLSFSSGFSFGNPSHGFHEDLSRPRADGSVVTHGTASEGLWTAAPPAPAADVEGRRAQTWPATTGALDPAAFESPDLAPGFVATEGMRLRSTGSDEMAHEAEASGEQRPQRAKGATKQIDRRAEQNRRAQAKFRQRKKDKLSDLEQQLSAMALQMECLKHEKDAYAEKALRLQQANARKDAQLAAIERGSKGQVASEELVIAFWDMVLELKQGKVALGFTRENIQDMVYSLLNWRSLDLGFIRREIVGQLRECVKQGGEVELSPSNRRLNQLITAYNKLVHRCGEINPSAFRTFLNLQLPEQQGIVPDTSFWQRVVEAGSLTPLQKSQLTGAKKQLVDKMVPLMSRRDVAGLNQPSSQGPLLQSMTQAKEVLDLHEELLREEQQAVLNFRTTVGLTLEPVQQAKLMIASFPFALDTLAICSVLSESEQALAMCVDEFPFLSQLPVDSPFQALASALPVNGKPPPTAATTRARAA